MDIVNSDYTERIKHGSPRFHLSIHYTTLEPKQSLALYHHKHDELELFFLLSGELQFLLDGNRQRLQQGEMMLVKPNVLHGAFKSVHLPVAFIAITFHQTFIASHINDTIQTDYLAPIFQKGYLIQQYYNLDFCEKQKLYDIMNRISDAYKNQNPGFELLIKSKLLELLYQIITPQLPLNTIATTESLDNLYALKDTLEYIEKNFSSQIKVSTLAKMLNMSEGHYSRIFKTHTGTTVGQFINNYRLNFAAQSLRNKALSISLIADMAGFKNLSYFTRAFKQAFTMTPKDYRKQFQ